MNAAAEADLGIGILKQAVDPFRCPADLSARMAEMAIHHLVAAKRVSEGHQLCPGCSNLGRLTDDPQVLRCEGCGGVFSHRHFPLVMAQALKFVALHQDMKQEAGIMGTFYFDLDILTEWNGRRAVGRVHGWADVETKRVVQFG